MIHAISQVRLNRPSFLIDPGKLQQGGGGTSRLKSRLPALAPASSVTGSYRQARPPAMQPTQPRPDALRPPTGGPGTHSPQYPALRPLAPPLSSFAQRGPLAFA